MLPHESRVATHMHVHTHTHAPSWGENYIVTNTLKCTRAHTQTHRFCVAYHQIPQDTGQLALEWLARQLSHHHTQTVTIHWSSPPHTPSLLQLLYIPVQKCALHKGLSIGILYSLCACVFILHRLSDNLWCLFLAGTELKMLIATSVTRKQRS